MFRARRMIGICASCMLGISGGTIHAQQATVVLRVDGNDGSTTGDGSGWNSEAFLYLQDALDEAQVQVNQGNLVQIWVRGNTTNPYFPDDGDNYSSGDATAFFELINNVRILGGFASGDDEA